MKFLKKKYFNIISLIIILLINYVLIYYIKNGTAESINEINYLKILRQSLTLPGVFIIMNIFLNKIISNKHLFIFTLFLICLEFILRYFNEKNVVDYNFVIGMLIGLVLTIIISSFKKKNNFKKTQLN